MSGIPFRFESLPRDSQRFLLRRVVQVKETPVCVDSNDDGVVERPQGPARFKAYDQRSARINVVLQFVPVAPKRIHRVACGPEVIFHFACGETAVMWRRENVLNLFRIRTIRYGLPQLVTPIPLDHRNHGRAAAILCCLRDERHVDPYRRRGRCKKASRGDGKRQGEAWNDARAHVRSADSHDNQNQRDDSNKDDDQIPVAHAAGSEVLSGLLGAGG